jgi:hypothetical protein
VRQKTKQTNKRKNNTMSCNCEGVSINTIPLKELLSIQASAMKSMASAFNVADSEVALSLHTSPECPKYFFGAADPANRRWRFYRKVGIFEFIVEISIEDKDDTALLMTISGRVLASGVEVVNKSISVEIYIGDGDAVFRPRPGNGDVNAMIDWDCIKKHAPQCIPVCVGDPTGVACIACVAGAALKCL